MDCVTNPSAVLLECDVDGPTRMALRVTLRVALRGSWAVPASITAHAMVGLALFLVLPARRAPDPPQPASNPVFFEAAPADPDLDPVLEMLAQTELPAPESAHEATILGAPRNIMVRATPPKRAVDARAVQPVTPKTMAGNVAAANSTVALPQAAPTNTQAPAARPAFSAAEFEARVHAAVQRVAYYPAAARLQRRQGRAAILFDYNEGAVSGAEVAQSSQSGLLDRAALDAVRRAALPRAVGVRKIRLLVWVDFNLVRED